MAEVAKAIGEFQKQFASQAEPAATARV